MSTIVTDTITGKSTATTVTIGSTPIVSASANSMTIRGEGSAQTSIQQGLCKSWFKFTQDTPAVLDSFNISSISDDSTGVHSGNFTNNMSNANYANSCMKQAELTNNNCTEYTTGSSSTSLVKRNDIENGSARDAGNTNTLTFGDLA